MKFSAASMIVGALLSVCPAAHGQSGLDVAPARVPRPPVAMPAPTVPGAEAPASPVVFEPRLAQPAHDSAERARARPDRHSRVYWDVDEQGTIWVRGRHYKASFGSEGATYFPLFGSQQPRHFPVHLSLASATSHGEPLPLAAITGAIRDGDKVVIHRGPVDEVYDIAVEHIEQTFVVHERPSHDLTLRIRAQSDLCCRENADGLEFESESGFVRYSQAFALNANGSKHPLSTRAVDDGIQIELAADYLLTAPMPLSIDPIVSTFTVDGSTYGNYLSDVAYDATTNRYLHAYTEFVNGTDVDVYSTIVDSSGTPLFGAYVDMSTDTWYLPVVANLNAYDQFLVAASVYKVGATSYHTDVQARQTSATTLAYGPTIHVADDVDTGPPPTSGFVTTVCEAGGDPYPTAPAFFCVVFYRPGTVTARLVTNTGALVGPGEIAVGTPGGRFGISAGNGGTRWNIVWARSVSAGLWNIHGAQLEWDGSAVATPDFIVSPAAPLGQPSVSSPLPNGQYMVAWQQGSGSDTDIHAALLSGSTLLDIVDLTVLEQPTSVLDQALPDVDTDGEQFAVAYQEGQGLLSKDVYLASFHVFAGSIAVSEAHVPVATSPAFDESHPALVSRYSTGGANRRYGLSWGDESGDIHGAFYDGLQGGPITRTCFGDGSGSACPCANNGSANRGCGNSAFAFGGQLNGTGAADVSSDSLVLTTNGVTIGAACLFFQGTSLFGGGNGIPYGDGLLCAGGTIVRLAVKFASGSVATFPQAGDPSLSSAGSVAPAGAQRYYQVWYRDAASFCTSQTYNLTNALKATWLP